MIHSLTFDFVSTETVLSFLLWHSEIKNFSFQCVNHCWTFLNVMICISVYISMFTCTISTVAYQMLLFLPIQVDAFKAPAWHIAHFSFPCSIYVCPVLVTCVITVPYFCACVKFTVNQCANAYLVASFFIFIVLFCWNRRKNNKTYTIFRWMISTLFGRALIEW